MAFAGVLGDFPSFNFEVIKSLIEHLKRVAGHSDTNMMKASNLSIIFGPNLLRSKESEANPLVALADNSQQSKVVEILIDQVDEIFTQAMSFRGTDPLPFVIPSCLEFFLTSL